MVDPGCQERKESIVRRDACRIPVPKTGYKNRAATDIAP